MENRIYMYDNAKNRQMMSFIITTKDGKVIVIDGGYDEDAEKLLKNLRQITGGDRPHIDAWFLSHAHEDHINALANLLENHCEDFTCDGYYYCFPSVQYVEKYEHGSTVTISRFYANLPKIASVANVVSAGDLYRIGDASFEILQTYDDTNTEDIVNNSSTVIRMTLGEKTVLFLGDLGARGGERLVARLKDSLKSDICQPAHHGQDGAERPVFYKETKPQPLLAKRERWIADGKDRLGGSGRKFGGEFSLGHKSDLRTVGGTEGNDDKIALPHLAAQRGRDMIVKTAVKTIRMIQKINARVFHQNPSFR